MILTITPYLIFSQTTEISIDEQKNDKSATKYREAGIGVGFGVVFNNYTNTNSYNKHNYFFIF